MLTKEEAKKRKKLHSKIRYLKNLHHSTETLNNEDFCVECKAKFPCPTASLIEFIESLEEE